MKLKPRYHFAGTHHRFYERTPYRYARVIIISRHKYLVHESSVNVLVHVSPIASPKLMEISPPPLPPPPQAHSGFSLSHKGLEDMVLYSVCATHHTYMNV